VVLSQVMHFGGFPFQVQLLLRLFFFGSRIAYFAVFCGGGVEAGLFPFLFLQGFEANIVLVAPHLIPEITTFSAIKMW